MQRPSTLLGNGPAFLWATVIGVLATWIAYCPSGMGQETSTTYVQQPPSASAEMPRDEGSITAILELYEITPDALARIPCSESMDVQDQETIVRILSAVRRVPTSTQAAWRQALPGREILRQQPADWTGKLVDVTGRVERVTAVTVPQQLGEALGRSEYFQCHVTLGHSKIRANLYVSHVPEAWSEPATAIRFLDQPFSCIGVLAGIHIDARDGADVEVNGGADSDSDALCLSMIVSRLYWLPDQASQEWGITEHHVRLAGLGVDFAALSEVIDQSELGISDHDSFFQLLSAMRPGDPQAGTPHWDETLGRPQPLPNMGDLLQYPHEHRGRWYATRGVARRALPIRIQEPDVAGLYGLDEYFEVVVYVDLEMPIVMHAGDDERRFARYPVVFCTPSLPPGMPSGDDIHESVELRGVFLKTWSYPAAWLTSQDARWRQFSPLLIGPQPAWTQPVASTSTRGHALGIALVLILAGAVMLAGWRMARANRLARELRRRRFHDETGPNFDEVDE